IFGDSFIPFVQLQKGASKSSMSIDIVGILLQQFALLLNLLQVTTIFERLSEPRNAPKKCHNNENGCRSGYCPMPNTTRLLQFDFAGISSSQGSDESAAGLSVLSATPKSHPLNVAQKIRKPELCRIRRVGQENGDDAS